MKKNWMLRLGLLAMVLTLVTMPMVSSTYAKYVTAASGTDTARVAKWGVTITADSAGDGMFDLTYVEDDATFTLGSNSVISNVNVVAPGTSGSYTFDLAGTPEVAVRVSFEASSTKDNWLAESKAYEPVNWTIAKGATYWDGDSWEAGKTYYTLAQLESQLSTLKVDYVANAAITTTYTIGWEWPFEWSSTYLAWSDMVDAVATDVSAFWVNTGVGTAELATGYYVEGTNYYLNEVAAQGNLPADRVSTTSFVTVAEAYDIADTQLGDKFLIPENQPSLTLNLRITATQIE